jgi:hypothetical protein
VEASNIDENVNVELYVPIALKDTVNVDVVPPVMEKLDCPLNLRAVISRVTISVV